MKHRKFTSIGILIACFSLAATALAQNKTAADIDKYLKPLVDKGQFAGVILAADRTGVIYEKAFGPAQAEFNIPNQTNTRFVIASVNKRMTALIAIKLMEAKKLAPQDKLSKFIPDFPSGELITIEMLMQHRSGIPHRAIADDAETRRYTPALMVEEIKKVKLAFPPGTADLYSSSGYTVLARVLELASGKPYAQLLHEYVFAPAGMKDSSDWDGGVLIDRRAQEYLLEAKGPAHPPLRDYSFIVGAGSVVSTARDLYQFANAVLDGKYGESVKASFVRDGVFATNGLTNGFRCNVQVDRTKGFAFILMSNMQSGANDLLVRDVPLILQGQTVAPPSIPAPVMAADSTDRLEDFFGDYKLGDGVFSVFARNGQLWAGIYKLYPMAKDRYFAFGYGAEVVFKRDAAGKVTECEWISPTFKISWTRQPLIDAGK
jgi:CubicO group peptidase (beta-lactamase class C family)